MRAQVELLQNVPIAGVEQHDVVGEIVRDQQPVAPFPDITARPAGYGIAVPAAVLRTPKATFLPAAMVCGAIFRKRSGVTLPFSNL